MQSHTAKGRKYGGKIVYGDEDIEREYYLYIHTHLLCLSVYTNSFLTFLEKTQQNH